MPLYHFHKDPETGESWLETVSDDYVAQAKPAPKPASAELGNVLHRCDAEGCGRKFKNVALLARHFGMSHKELRQNKDSWRDYHTELRE